MNNSETGIRQQIVPSASDMICLNVVQTLKQDDLHNLWQDKFSNPVNNFQT